MSVQIKIKVAMFKHVETCQSGTPTYFKSTLCHKTVGGRLDRVEWIKYLYISIISCFKAICTTERNHRSVQSVRMYASAVSVAVVDAFLLSLVIILQHTPFILRSVAQLSISFSVSSRHLRQTTNNIPKHSLPGKLSHKCHAPRLLFFFM